MVYPIFKLLLCSAGWNAGCFYVVPDEMPDAFMQYRMKWLRGPDLETLLWDDCIFLHEEYWKNCSRTLLRRLRVYQQFAYFVTVSSVTAEILRFICIFVRPCRLRLYWQFAYIRTTFYPHKCFVPFLTELAATKCSTCGEQNLC